MAFTFVQRAQAQGPSLTGVAAGNLLIVQIGWASSSVTISSISGNSNTWVQAPTTYGSANSNLVNQEIYYVLSANAGTTTPSVTWSGTTPTSRAMHIYEFAWGAAPIFDKGNVEAFPSGSFVSTTTLTVVSANANSLLFSGLLNDNSGPSTVPSGWATALTSNIAYYQYSSYLLDAGGAGTENAFWGTINFGNYVESIVVFYETGAPAGGTRGTPIGSGGTAFNGGRTFMGPID